MEKTNPKEKAEKPFKESDSRPEKFAPEDAASYYLGDSFEMGGVEYGWREEEERNSSRFGEKVWNEKDHLGSSDLEREDDAIYRDVLQCLADTSLDISGIDVDVKQSCIYLRGRVSDRREKREAERSVEFIPGVRDVMNELTF